MDSRECKNMDKESNGKDNRFINNIINNYLDVEKSIVNQLKLYNVNHPYTTGALREDIWMQLFDMIIPKKFVIEHSIFIIDSHGRISKEVDLAIIDNTYTPYIFQYGRLKYVPIEAVAAVIECKSTSISMREKGKDGEEKETGLTIWCKSIQELQTSPESIVRMATGIVIDGVLDGSSKSSGDNQKPARIPTSAQTSTRPIRIFCGYETHISEKDMPDIKNLFDFVLLAREYDNAGKIKITANKEYSLQDWYKELNHYGHQKQNVIETEEGEIQIIDGEKLKNHNLDCFKVVANDREISLLSFNFQLNQLLMLINNPILFPHRAYAKMFTEGGGISDGRKKD